MRRPLDVSMPVPLHDQIMLQVRLALSEVTAYERHAMLDDRIICSYKNTDGIHDIFYSATIIFNKKI